MSERMKKWSKMKRYVYLARIDGTDFYKLGSSHNIELRLNNLRYEAVRKRVVKDLPKLSLVHKCRVRGGYFMCNEYEDYLHLVLYEFRANRFSGREWYRLSDEVVDFIIKDAKRLYYQGRAGNLWRQDFAALSFSDYIANKMPYKSTSSQRHPLAGW